MAVKAVCEIAEAISETICKLQPGKRSLLIALDGRCAAGKTTLAAHLQEKCGCNVIHMDHFFLRSGQRTEARLNEPGGNVDYERFLQEMLIPLKEGKAFSYRPYDCSRQALAQPIWIEPLPITIVEGAYSCHPALREGYDLRIFLTVDGAGQIERIRQRNGEAGVAIFQEKWIPLEERYFAACQVKKCCDLCFET